MRKLKLRAIELGATEVLTREQLRMATGGGSLTVPCVMDSQCTSGKVCRLGDCVDPSGSGGSGGDGMGGCSPLETQCSANQMGCCTDGYCVATITGSGMTYACV